MNESWNPLLKSYPFSEKVNALTLGAEMLFVRLIAQADDYGNYYGDPRLILASLFPHRFAKKEVNETDTGRWRTELVTNPVGPLAALYTANGSEYIHLLNSRRRTRTDVKPDQRFPREPDDIEEKATFDHVTRTGRIRNVHVPLDQDTDQDQDQEEPIVGESRQAIDHLNEEAGTRYKHSESSLKHIRARIQDGATMQDIRAVIEHKVAQWKDDAKMREYLRPSTLFRPSHFEEYVDAARRWVEGGRVLAGETKNAMLQQHDPSIYDRGRRGG